MLSARESERASLLVRGLHHELAHQLSHLCLRAHRPANLLWLPPQHLRLFRRGEVIGSRLGSLTNRSTPRAEDVRWVAIHLLLSLDELTHGTVNHVSHVVRGRRAQGPSVRGTRLNWPQAILGAAGKNCAQPVVTHDAQVLCDHMAGIGVNETLKARIRAWTPPLLGCRLP